MHTVESVITPTIEGLGYRLVQVIFAQDVLQIMVERTDNASISVEECKKISREVSIVLDVENVIQKSYRLEISSPGIDRPLLTKEDFEKYVGFEAAIKMQEPIEGRQNFKGHLEGLHANQIKMMVDGKEYHLPYEKIGKAKLVLTDQLLSKM